MCVCVCLFVSFLLDCKRSAVFFFRLKKKNSEFPASFFEIKPRMKKHGVRFIGCSLFLWGCRAGCSPFLGSVLRKRFLQLMEYSVSRASWVLKNTRFFAVQQQTSCKFVKGSKDRFTFLWHVGGHGMKN